MKMKITMDIPPPSSQRYTVYVAPDKGGRSQTVLPSPGFHWFQCHDPENTIASLGDRMTPSRSESQVETGPDSVHQRYASYKMNEKDGFETGCHE